MRTCILIPTYQGERSLPGLFAKMPESISVEDILVVDDGSVDRTSDVCSDCGIKVIRHETNLGKGAALKTGFAYALENGYDAVVTIPAPPHPPPALNPGVIAELESGADVVVGNRVRDTTMPIERRLSNFLSSFWISVLAGRKFPDSQCGFRAVKRWILEKAHLHFNRYQTESELLIESARIGAKISFVSIPTIYNGDRSYFHPITDTARFIAFVLMYYPTRK